MPEAPSAPPPRHYDLNGITLSLEATDSALAGFLDHVLEPFAGPAVPADWRLRVSFADSLPAAEGALQWEGAMPEGIAAALFHGEGWRLLLVPGQFSMLCDMAARRATVLALPGQSRWLAGTASFWLIERLLETADRHLVHAACLVRAAGDAVLIFAPSGTGKTTTSLALARNGWALAGDDAAVIEPGAAQPKVWALPRGINLHRRTAAMLPWLAPIVKDYGEREEQGLALSSLRGILPLASPAARRCAGVLLLEPPNLEDHRVWTLPKSEAAVAILMDNVRIGPGGLDSADGIFGALTRLLAAVPVAALSAGPDPSSLSPRILEAALGLA
jgi:hypothetical protein